jgi:hypothetical protein
MDQPTLELCQQIGRLRSAISHRPFQADSKAYRAFAEKQLKTAENLANKHPGLRLSSIIEHFESARKKT